MRRTAISIIVLTVSALFSVTPLILHKGFIGGGWDLSQHMNWAEQVNIGLREGILYPRWMSLSNGGYGSPTMTFYSPLFYLLTGFLNLFIPSLTISLKIATIAGFIFSGFSMYLLLRNFCSNTASIVGGIAYQLLPYHVFALYLRETLAEAFAFIWLPLIIHFAYKGFKQDRLSNWIGMSFSYAGLILTHIASAYIFTFAIGCFGIFLSIREKSLRSSLKFIMSFMFGISLSAVYFIPMLFERKFVHIEWMTKIWGEFQNHFLFADKHSYLHLEQILVLQALFVIIFLILIDYRWKKHLWMPNRNLVFFFLLFILAIYMSTPISTPIWILIKGLQTLVFPWRWMTASTFAVSVLIGLTIDSFRFSDYKRDRFIRILIALFFAVVFINIYYSSQYIMAAEPMQKERMQQILSDRTDMATFRPIWHTQQKGKDWDPSTEEWMPVKFKQGNGNIEIVSWKSQSRLFNVNASSESIIRVSTFYYPGWTALINGEGAFIEIEDESGAILLSIPQGENTVLLEFKDTPLRRFAGWVSIISIITAFIAVFMEKIKVFNPFSSGRD